MVVGASTAFPPHGPHPGMVPMYPMSGALPHGAVMIPMIPQRATLPEHPAAQPHAAVMYHPSALPQHASSHGVPMYAPMMDPRQFTYAPWYAGTPMTPVALNVVPMPSPMHGAAELASPLSMASMPGRVARDYGSPRVRRYSADLRRSLSGVPTTGPLAAQPPRHRGGLGGELDVTVSNPHIAPSGRFPARDFVADPRMSSATIQSTTTSSLMPPATGSTAAMDSARDLATSSVGAISALDASATDTEDGDQGSASGARSTHRLQQRSRRRHTTATIMTEDHVGGLHSPIVASTSAVAASRTESRPSGPPVITMARDAGAEADLTFGPIPAAADGSPAARTEASADSLSHSAARSRPSAYSLPNPRRAPRPSAPDGHSRRGSDASSSDAARDDLLRADDRYVRALLGHVFAQRLHDIAGLLALPFVAARVALPLLRGLEPHILSSIDGCMWIASEIVRDLTLVGLPEFDFMAQVCLRDARVLIKDRSAATVLRAMARVAPHRVAGAIRGHVVAASLNPVSCHVIQEMARAAAGSSSSPHDGAPLLVGALPMTLPSAASTRAVQDQLATELEPAVWHLLNDLSGNFVLQRCVESVRSS